MIHARSDYNRIQDPENKIPEDEPVFLIRAKDLLGPLVVSFWAMQAESLGVDPKLVQAALNQALAMDAYQKKHGMKYPDAPEGTV